MVVFSAAAAAKLCLLVFRPDAPELREYFLNDKSLKQVLCTMLTTFIFNLSYSTIDLSCDDEALLLLFSNFSFSFFFFILYSKKWTDARTPKFVIQIEVTARRERRPVFERTAAAAAHDYVRLWQAVLPCALHRERERERKRKRERHLFRHLIARLVVHHTLHCSKIRSLPLFACPPKTKER